MKATEYESPQQITMRKEHSELIDILLTIAGEAKGNVPVFLSRAEPMLHAFITIVLRNSSAFPLSNGVDFSRLGFEIESERAIDPISFRANYYTEWVVQEIYNNSNPINNVPTQTA